MPAPLLTLNTLSQAKLMAAADDDDGFDALQSVLRSPEPLLMRPALLQVKLPKGQGCERR